MNFENKPHFEKETCCITHATQSQINTAINIMMHDRAVQVENGEDLREEDFTDEQVEKILTKQNHECLDEYE